jgi:hypothetical protein
MASYRERRREGVNMAGESMMPESVQRFSDDIMLQLIGIDHVLCLWKIPLKGIVI